MMKDQSNNFVSCLDLNNNNVTEKRQTDMRVTSSVNYSKKAMLMQHRLHKMRSLELVNYCIKD